MIIDRYYYHQLNKKEQAIYKAFYDGVKEHKDVIPVPVKGIITEETFIKVFFALTRDNPLIYYLNQSACYMAQDALGHNAICPKYFFEKDKVKEYNRKIEKVVNDLAASLKLTEGTDYDKALKVHDWLCQNISYDEKGSDKNELVRVIASHNIIGVFAHHRAQCEGIAKAVKVLLNAVDVKCIVATGEADSSRENGPHAWNVVSLDGQSYHMDVTWDIGARKIGVDDISYDYFNVSDELISVDHMADAKLPECKSMELNYFTKNKVCFSSKAALLAYVTKVVRMGRTGVYFRLEGKLNRANIVNDIISVISKIMAQLGQRQVKVQKISNETIGTYWIRIK